MLDNKALVEYSELAYQVQEHPSNKQLQARANSFKNAHFHTPKEKYLAGRFRQGYLGAKTTRARRYSKRTVEIFKSTRDVDDRCLTLAKEGIAQLVDNDDFRIPFEINIRGYHPDLEKNRGVYAGNTMFLPFKEAHPEYAQGQILVVVDPADKLSGVRDTAEGNTHAWLDGHIAILAKSLKRGEPYLRRLAKHESYHVILESRDEENNGWFGYEKEPLCIGFSFFNNYSPGLCGKCSDGAIYLWRGIEAALGEEIITVHDDIKRNLKREIAFKQAREKSKSNNRSVLDRLRRERR